MREIIGSGIGFVPSQIENRRKTLAPWIAGCALDIFGAGIFASLLLRYFANRAMKRSGSRRLTIFVCVVAILSIFKTAAALYVLFLNSVTLNGDIVGLALAEIQNWAMGTETLMTHIIDMVIQSYYILILHNLFQFNGGHQFHPALRWGLFTLIFACTIASTAMAIMVTDELLSFRLLRIRQYLIAQLSISFFTDALITGSTIYCLYRAKPDTTRAKSILSRFARIIAQSAALPAFFALVNVAIVYANKYFNRWHLFFDYGLSKAFAISLMWTIEVRDSMLDRGSIRNREVTPSTSIPERQSRDGSHNLLTRPSVFAKTIQVSRLPSATNPTLEMDDRSKVQSPRY